MEHEPPVGLMRGQGALPDLGQRAVAPVGQPEDHPVGEHGADLAEQRRPVGGDDGAQPDRAALAEHLEQALDQPSHVVLAEGRVVALPPVEQQEHPRQPVRARSRRPLLGEPREALRGEQLLAARDLVAELAEQPLHPVGLLPGHHGAAVRQLAYRQQRAGPAVDPVDVHVGGRGVRGHRAGQRAQQAGPPAARRAGYHGVPGGREVQRERRPGLPVRQVGEPVGDRRDVGVPAGAGAGGRRGQFAERDDLRQGL